jgi:hypothetical protein
VKNTKGDRPPFCSHCCCASSAELFCFSAPSWSTQFRCSHQKLSPVMVRCRRQTSMLKLMVCSQSRFSSIIFSSSSPLSFVFPATSSWSGACFDLRLKRAVKRESVLWVRVSPVTSCAMFFIPLSKPLCSFVLYSEKSSPSFEFFPLTGLWPMPI